MQLIIENALFVQPDIWNTLKKYIHECNNIVQKVTGYSTGSSANQQVHQLADKYE
jgi:hypothetical protein